tara:strand:- start:80 stop:325 length:246 start_codon:yes stop_codon:yes gene_type:complete
MFKFLAKLFGVEEQVAPKEPVIKAGVVDTGKAPKKFPADSVLKGLTKKELEELARTHGVELDRRKTKVNMIADFKKEAKKK